MFFYSYLADQCWSGGFIYLIMLRRMKRKAPPPPPPSCNTDDSVSFSVSSGDQTQEKASSEPSEISKRTRKFGVVSRSSFTRDNRDSTDSEPQTSYNGHDSSVPMDSHDDSGSVVSTYTQTREIPDAFSQVGSIPHRLQSRGAATLPKRCHSHLFECQTDSFGSEISSQVTHSADMHTGC